MSKDSSEKGQQDRSEGKYDPPSSPGIFSSKDKKEEYFKEKDAYDKSWEVTKAQQDQSENKYRPPSTPSILDSSSEYSKSKKWSERESYDKSWEDSRKNSESQDDEKKSGCFITSACVESKGLHDNCMELEILRSFRDGYVLALTDGKRLIHEYYSEAPKIVNRINQDTRRKEIYNWLYVELIQKSIESIKEGDNHAAFENYKAIFKYLQYESLDS